MHKAQSMMVSQGEVTCLGDLSCELKNPPPTRKKNFLLGRTSYRYLWLLRLGFGDLADIFLEMNNVSLSLRGKQLTAFVTKNYQK